ncbi:hypothetical protein FO584_00310 [Bacillus thuringiensis]|nr:hypothetical protein [Bacillus thuringiensis]
MKYKYKRMKYKYKRMKYKYKRMKYKYKRMKYKSCFLNTKQLLEFFGICTANRYFRSFFHD